MAAIPPAIILVNNDLTTSVRDSLVRQLYIDEVVDGYIYDYRVSLNPRYPNQMRESNQRIMVLKNFDDLINRSTFDLVGWVAHGMIAIEVNNFGPPGLTLPLARLTYHSLGYF